MRGRTFSDSYEKDGDYEDGYMITKRCGTCKYWHTDRGYECIHAGQYGGDFQDKEKYPYCKWTLKFRDRVKVLFGKDEIFKTKS